MRLTISQQVYSFLHEDDTYIDPGGIAGFLGLFDHLLHAVSMMSKTLRLRNDLSKCHTSVSDQQDSQCDSPSYSPEISRSEGEAGPILQACFEALEEFDTWDAEAEPFWKQTFEGLAVPAALGE